MVWRAEDPQGNEAMKVRWIIAPFTRGRGLDLGCGLQKPFDHFIGVDSKKDTQLFGIQMKPDVVADITKLDMFADESMDFVFSSHALEHFEYRDVKHILAEWGRVLKVGGYLVLYLPDRKLYPKKGQPGANPDHKWDPDYGLVHEALTRSGLWWDIGIYELRDQGMEYSGLYIVRKRAGACEDKEGVVYESWRTEPKPEKTVCVVRSGAVGDLIQASSVCAGLKKQDYHVTLLSTYPRCEIMANDPNIDRIIAVDDGQIPLNQIGDFWVAWRERFDRWVNLTNSVEQTMLSMPGFIMHEWAPAARHQYMNHNYLELQHELARVPHEPNVRFYPTEAEREWARNERKKYGEKLIMWVMSGSGHVHKHYPYTAWLINRLMTSTDVDVMTQGDEAAQELEKGITPNERVHFMSGKWSIRQTLAFLEFVDVLVGPETGILNAASCMEKLPKICFLSHSTDENLTRDWLNVAPMAAPVVQCPGRGNNEAPACHMMHFDWKPACRKNDVTGAAECQSQIHPERVWKALMCAIETGELR